MREKGSWVATVSPVVLPVRLNCFGFALKLRLLLFVSVILWSDSNFYFLLPYERALPSVSEVEYVNGLDVIFKITAESNIRFFLRVPNVIRIHVLRFPRSLP